MIPFCDAALMRNQNRQKHKRDAHLETGDETVSKSDWGFTPISLLHVWFGSVLRMEGRSLDPWAKEPLKCTGATQQVRLFQRRCQMTHRSRVARSGETPHWLPELRDHVERGSWLADWTYSILPEDVGERSRPHTHTHARSNSGAYLDLLFHQWFWPHWHSTLTYSSSNK